MSGRIVHNSLPILFLVIIGTAALSCGTQEPGIEISSQKNVISCLYQGLGERDGEPIVELLLINKTGKNLQAVYASLLIVDANGTTVQQTGFTYGRPFLKGEKKYIPAFEYIPLKEDALAVLKQSSGHTPIVFRLSEIVDENSKSVAY